MIKKDFIKDNVHEYYWHEDINCATTMIKTLSKHFDIKINQQLIDSAIGMHGAGAYGAQCGLVEGSLMFLGIYGREQNMTSEEIVNMCNSFAKLFEERYTSLLCSTLRPEGFKEENPPHLCEGFTCNAIVFTIKYINDMN